MVITNKNKFNKKYGFKSNESHSKEEISKLTGINLTILNKVYERGLGARITNPESVRRASNGIKIGGKSLAGKMSGPAWGYGRIYSFVMGGNTQKTADNDLWREHLKNTKVLYSQNKSKQKLSRNKSKQKLSRNKSKQKLSRNKSKQKLSRNKSKQKLSRNKSKK